MDVEKPLPRGGKRSAASALELREAQRAAERSVAVSVAAGEDFLHDAGAAPQAKRAKKSKHADPELAAIDEEAAAFAEGVAAAAGAAPPTRATLLRGAELRGGGAEATRCLGVVQAVRDGKELVVSLPHGLRGFAQPSDCSTTATDAPPLAEMYTVGETVACAVKAVEGGKGGRRVQLSLAPTANNAALRAAAGPAGRLVVGASLVGCALAEEDHGFSVDLGGGLPAAFVKHKVAPAGLMAGKCFRCVVTKASGRAVEVAALAPAGKKAAKAPREAVEYAGITLQALQPGDLVRAAVRAELSDGLQLSFLSYFTGTVDPFHVGAEEHAKGDKLLARVLYVARVRLLRCTGARAAVRKIATACAYLRGLQEMN